MRSFNLCLLVLFISSCMIDTINATSGFCGPSGVEGSKGKDDCAEFPPPDKSAFHWTVASSFDNRKLVPDDEYVEIDMHRALLITDFQRDVTFADADFKSEDREQCRLIFAQAGTQHYIKNDFTNLQIITTTSVQKAFMAVVDPKCRLYIAKKTFTNGDDSKMPTLFHVFLRDLYTGMYHESARKDPLKSGHFIISQKKGIIEGSVNSQIVVDNSLFRFPGDVDTNTEKECFHMCQYGTLFTYDVKKGGATFANKFKLKKRCEWMSIYLHRQNESYSGNSAEISLLHGFVKLPQEVKVHPMDFEAFEPLGDVFYEVNVIYSMETVGPPGSKIKTRQMEIFNSHGRAVRSLVMQGNAKKIDFAFSDNDCLAQPIGSQFAPESGTNKMDQKDFEFARDMNIAHKIGQEPSQRAVRFVRTPFTDPLVQNYQRPGEGFVKINKDDEEVIKFVEQKVAKPRAPEEATGVTNVKPEGVHINVMGPDEIAKLEEDKIRKERYEALKKRISEGNYYMFWAIPAGFATGSFGTFILCNIILFFFKRSVLTFWYKAMYKRYGSDTTMGAGTTMGKTMGGETIGGGTTMGGTTVGGTTAGGETTGSTTAA